MSGKIVASIGLIIDNQEIEKCITEKFKASSDTYYRNHKKIQNMISEKDFIEVINHVSVRFDNENMFICINPKGLDLIEPEHRARIIEACYEYLHRIASEYFYTGTKVKDLQDLTKEKIIEIIANKDISPFVLPTYVMDVLTENLDEVCKGRGQNADLIDEILGNILKGVTCANAVGIIINKWNDLTRSEQSEIAEELVGVRYKNYIMTLFNCVA